MEKRERLVSTGWIGSETAAEKAARGAGLEIQPPRDKRTSSEGLSIVLTEQNEGEEERPRHKAPHGRGAGRGRILAAHRPANLVKPPSPMAADAVRSAGKAAGTHQVSVVTPPPPAEEMPTVEENKEVFAAARITKQKKKSDTGVTMGEQVSPTSSKKTHRIARYMKKGLKESIANISDEKKMRALDPTKDFTIKSKVKIDAYKGCIVPESEEEPFVFTGYSPMCYRHIREFLGVSASEYMDELCKTQWTVSGAGKSAATLYFAGQKYVVKTMTQGESRFLRRIIHLYYHHIRQNPHTLLPRYFGHYSVKLLTTGEKIPFVVMNNVFNTGGNKIHEKYDLKGSTQGRYAKDGEKIMKDLDLERLIFLGARRKQILMGQVYRDTSFLKNCQIMDYSFLLGIHKPQTPEEVQRILVCRYDDERCLQADEGGMLNDGGSSEHAGEIYYGGIIDILQEYTPWKKAEHLVKGVQHGRSVISAVPPGKYAERFYEWLWKRVV